MRPHGSLRAARAGANGQLPKAGPDAGCYVWHLRQRDLQRRLDHHGLRLGLFYESSGNRWTVASNYQLLDSPGNSDYFGSGAVSSDGSVIVGENPQPSQFAAFRWTANGLMTLPQNIAAAVSADGSMVVGGDNWWKTSGQTGIFGPFPGEQDQTAAYGLSPDGQVAVGAAIKGSDPFGPTFRAFQWTLATGLQDLGLTTGTQSSANAISADGLVVVGQATDSSGFWRAFRWTAATGMQDIGTLGGPMSNATAVNSDGT